jgi:molybdopterin synthase sulfur carrier subunit
MYCASGLQWWPVPDKGVPDGRAPDGRPLDSSGPAPDTGRPAPAATAVTVVLPSILQPLAGGQSVLTAPADGPLTVAKLLDSVTADFAVLARRLRDETGALRRFVNIYVDGDEVRRLQGLQTEVAPGQEVLVIQSVAGG